MTRCRSARLILVHSKPPISREFLRGIPAPLISSTIGTRERHTSRTRLGGEGSSDGRQRFKVDMVYDEYGEDGTRSVPVDNMTDLRRLLVHFNGEEEWDPDVMRIERYDEKLHEWVEMNSFEQLAYSKRPTVRLEISLNDEDEEVNEIDEDPFEGNDRLIENTGEAVMVIRRLDHNAMNAGLWRSQEGKIMNLDGSEADIRSFILHASRSDEQLQDLLLARPDALDHIINCFQTFPFLLTRTK